MRTAGARLLAGSAKKAHTKGAHKEARRNKATVTNARKKNVRTENCSHGKMPAAKNGHIEKIP